MVAKKKAADGVHILPVEREEPSLTAEDVAEVLQEAGVLAADRKVELIAAGLLARLARR